MRRLRAPQTVEEELGRELDEATAAKEEDTGQGAEEVMSRVATARAAGEERAWGREDGEGNEGGKDELQTEGGELREGDGQEAAFLEPPSEDYVEGLIMAEAERHVVRTRGGGGLEGAPRGGAPGGGSSGTGRGRSANSGNAEAGRKRDVYSMDGIMLGDIVPVDPVRTGAKKRSRFRF